MEDAALAARESVASYLEALLGFVAPIDTAHRVSRLLQASISHWRSEAIGAALAAESCEVVVTTLRLLRGDIGLPATHAVHAYTCSFLVLASTVRVFEEARDIPVPGQGVTLSGLQSVGAQHLNGAVGVIMRFHPESGRFIVRLAADDPPADWKKVRPENLVLAPNQSPQAHAVFAARAHGRSCLEAVADIFDDLLQDMLIEALEFDGDCMQKCLAAELAAAMWEVLVCCAGDGSLRLSGANFAELCGSTSLCSLFARYILSAQVGLYSLWPADQDVRGLRRLRGLQESLLRSYCELYQPAAFWKDSVQAGESPMATLQAELEGHKRSLAEAAISFDVLPALIDAVDFHLFSVSVAEKPEPLPIVLPVLLSRLVCTLLTPATAAIGAGRHVQMHMVALTEVVHLFATLVVTRLVLHGPGATPSAEELLASLRAVLDSLVACASIGAWNLGGEVSQTLEAATLAILDSSSAAADAGVLARLVLVFMQQPPASAAAIRLAGAYSVLDQAYQTLFWIQVRARATLRNVPASDAQRIAQNWLTSAGVACDCIAANEALEAWHSEDANQHQEIDFLIEKCLLELPQKLRELPTTPLVSARQHTPHVEAPLIGASESVPPLQGSEQPIDRYRDTEANRLSMLGMPALPGQPGSPKNGSTGRRRKLVRTDFGKIRGVDPAMAPAELRCAIDGKILGIPLRSPYGHLFEKETLENWVNMCGSVCPLTGQPLRLEECQEDRVIAQKVLEWAKATKAEHRRRVQERRERRQAEVSPQETGVLI